jgi:hypothetical protein
VRKIILGALILSTCGVASAVETYECTYSKAALDNGKVGQMYGAMPAKVEVNGESIKTFRPDGSFIISPPLTKKSGPLSMADDGSKVYAAANDSTSFAVSDRIAKVTEQWEKCGIDGRVKSDNEMKYIESMTSAQAKKYFMNEKHAFTTNCLVWDDVTMITGKSPAILMAGSVNMGKNPRWDGNEYSFTFNGGSMRAAFKPSEKRHKFIIQAGDKFYGCGPSEIDRRFE